MEEWQRPGEARGKVRACCCCAEGRKGKGFGTFLSLLQISGSMVSPLASFVLRKSYQDGARSASGLVCMRQTWPFSANKRNGRGDENLSDLAAILASDISVELLWAGSTALKNRFFGKNNLIHCLRVTNTTLIVSRMVCMLVWTSHKAHSPSLAFILWVWSRSCASSAKFCSSWTPQASES